MLRIVLCWVLFKVCFFGEAAWKEALAMLLPLSASQVGCFCPENNEAFMTVGLFKFTKEYNLGSLTQYYLGILGIIAFLENAM